MRLNCLEHVLENAIIALDAYCNKTFLFSQDWFDAVFHWDHSGRVFLDRLVVTFGTGRRVLFLPPLAWIYIDYRRVGRVSGTCFAPVPRPGRIRRIVYFERSRVVVVRGA